MKLVKNISLLVLICTVMVACGPKKHDDTTDPVDNNDNTEVTDTNVQTNPANMTTYGGKQYDLNLCCDPGHLNNPNSLLSERIINFAYDQATVESQYRELIAIHARYLSQNPSAKMVLEGHADERGTPEYNLALGEKRGNSVLNLLRAQGASSAQVTVVSFGEEKPVSLCNDESCWSQNRRVRIVYTAK